MKNIAFTISFLLVCVLAKAQFVEKDKRDQPKDTVVSTNTQPITPKKKKGGFDMDKLAVGGNFGLSFGGGSNNRLFTIEVSPALGYRVSERFIPGVGATYMYFSANINGFEYTTNVYGFRSFVQYNVLENIFLWGEYETLNLEVYNINENSLEREWVGSPLVGGGYRVPMGMKNSFAITILYNLNYQENRSPYGSPIVLRGGILF